MMTTTTMTRTLAKTVQEATAAEAAAARKAAAAASAAQQRAEAAKAAADLQREQANKDFLDVLVKEYPSARSAALATQAEARAAFSSAVRGEGGDLLTTYRAMVESRIEVWALDAALHSQRQYFGITSREPSEPAFDFTIEVAQVANQHSYEVMDAATGRRRERRQKFLNGETQS
jgi:L-fucose isomerase-like protein